MFSNILQDIAVLQRCVHCLISTGENNLWTDRSQVEAVFVKGWNERAVVRAERKWYSKTSCINFVRCYWEITLTWLLICWLIKWKCVTSSDGIVGLFCSCSVWWCINANCSSEECFKDLFANGFHVYHCSNDVLSKLLGILVISHHCGHIMCSLQY